MLLLLQKLKLKNKNMEQNKSSIGSIIGTIIIIAIIILGGLYFWGKRVEEAKLNQELLNQQAVQPVVELTEAEKIRTTNSGDDLKSLEADLSATKTEDLDGELNIVVE